MSKCIPDRLPLLVVSFSNCSTFSLCTAPQWNSILCSVSVDQECPYAVEWGPKDSHQIILFHVGWVILVSCVNYYIPIFIVPDFCFILFVPHFFISIWSYQFKVITILGSAHYRPTHSGLHGKLLSIYSDPTVSLSTTYPHQLPAIPFDFPPSYFLAPCRILIIRSRSAVVTCPCTPVSKLLTMNDTQWDSEYPE